MGREHVALGRDVAQARAQGQDQIAGIEGRDLRGGRRQVQVPSVQRMRVGKEVVLPERHRHRNRMPLGQPAQRLAPIGPVERAARDDQGPARLRQQSPGCGTAACCTSSGTTITTGPGVPDVATRMALKAAAASSSGVDTSTTHLAIEPNISW
ncbi:hypothetical protein G6F46_014362 [Rhizopus delemar]|nr:hypothetical protein G6F46_014362 [Rhizopus delemar]